MTQAQIQAQAGQLQQQRQDYATSLAAAEMMKQGIPVTMIVRPAAALLEQAAAACEAAGVQAKVYTGTTYSGLGRQIPGLLTQSGGAPIAIVCYGGSEYGKKPRRLSSVVVVVVQGHTRAAPGGLTAIDAAGKIVDQLDDSIYQDTGGDCIITEHWRAASDEPIDIEGLEAAAVLLTFEVEDY